MGAPIGEATRELVVGGSDLRSAPNGEKADLSVEASDFLLGGGALGGSVSPANWPRDSGVKRLSPG